jgi:hypothetical protein
MRLPPPFVVVVVDDVVVVVFGVLVRIVVICVHEQIIGEQIPSSRSELAVRTFLHQSRNESSDEYSRLSRIREESAAREVKYPMTTELGRRGGIEIHESGTIGRYVDDVVHNMEFAHQLVE